MYVRLSFGKNGLIPLIIQDAESDTVLSLFYANAVAIRKMQTTGYVWRYSRSKKKLLKKGASSGNIQKIVSISSDCDRDALLVKVKPQGPTCHTSQYSCFGEEKGILTELLGVIAERKRNPTPSSYTSIIIQNRTKIIAKLREECGELIRAKTQKDIRWEAADLLYFLLVYLENRNVQWAEVLTELKRRRKIQKR